MVCGGSRGQNASMTAILVAIILNVSMIRRKGRIIKRFLKEPEGLKYTVQLLKSNWSYEQRLAKLDRRKYAKKIIECKNVDEALEKFP